MLKALWLFIAGVFAVLVIYYLLTGVEQGIDVVIQSGERVIAGLLTTICVSLWSFLVWYSSRMLSYIRQHKDDEVFWKRGTDDIETARLYRKYCVPAAMYMHLPRILAYNCFVSIQVAIFHLPTFFSFTTWPMIAVIIAHNGFYFLFVEWLQPSGKVPLKLLRYLNYFFIAAYSCFLIVLIAGFAADADTNANPYRHRFWLSVIALTMFMLQLLSVFLFVLRRKIIDDRRSQKRLRVSSWLQSLGFNPGYNAAEAPYFRLLNGVAIVAGAVYLAAIFIMPFPAMMGPMAIALLALGVLTGFFNLISVISIRRSFNITVVLLAFAFLFGLYRDPYPVRLLETDRLALFANRDDAQTFLDKWFSRRMDLIKSADSTTRFPLYLVLSNGGASRAGRWTSSVLSMLQDSTYRENPRDSFKDHILCIAGASGGTVGNCVFYSMLSAVHAGEVKGDEFEETVDGFFRADFLSFTLARLFGPDIFRHLVPFPIPVDNRADALERVIAHGSNLALFSKYFEKPLSEVLDTTGSLPAIFINTTQVDNGMPGVISSIMLPERSQRQDVLSLVDSAGMSSSRGDMRLSTAAVLSSRFPYVSPAGKVFDRYYVDGGYFDNSGAGTVLEFIRELNRYLADSTRDVFEYRDMLTFHLIHLTNSEVVESPLKDIHPLSNDLFSPLITLAGMQGSSTSIGDGMLIDAFRQFNTDTLNARIVYSLYDETWDPSKNNGEFEEGYPMSWALSDYQLYRMGRAVERVRGR